VPELALISFPGNGFQELRVLRDGDLRASDAVGLGHSAATLDVAERHLTSVARVADGDPVDGDLGIGRGWQEQQKSE